MLYDVFMYRGASATCVAVLVQSAPGALSLIRRLRLCLDSLTGTGDVMRTVTSPIVAGSAGEPHMKRQVVEIPWGTGQPF